MTAFDIFQQKLKSLEEMLGGKPFAPVPDKVWQTPTKALDKLLGVLDPYYTEPRVPTKADIAIVKGHGITAQIKAFIDRDKDRKAFFSVDYFEKKCAVLSDKDLVQALPGGSTRLAFLTTYLAYRYWSARPNSLNGLEKARAEFEEDFNNNPATRQAEEANALYRKLLHEPDFNRVVTLLQERYPDGDGVKAFAKAVSLKIPAGKRSVHERIAAKILKAGELVRAKF